jgi:hypothetical protein
MSPPERDRWIIGSDPTMELEFIVHTHAPRFIAQIINDATEHVCKTAENAGQAIGFVHGDLSETEIRVISWIDPSPTGMWAKDPLMEAAMQAFLQYEEALASNFPSIQ